MINTIIYGASVLLPVLILIVIYNKLAQRRIQIENAISSTDALFIKRSDLIPNLIATLKRYMTFESEVLEKITELRNSKVNTDPEAEKQAQQALKSLMIQVEAYPDLKANTNFRDLQYSMNEVEEQISAGRRYISASITNYNNSVVSFPNNLIAGVFGFKKYEWQYAKETQRENIDANKLFK